MNKQQLEQYKQTYLKQTVSEHAIQENWERVKILLPQQAIVKQQPYVRYPFIIAGVVLFLLGGTLGVAQASTPGTPLYLVKVLSDKVVATVVGKPEIAVDKRAKDVMQTVKVSPKALPTAVSQYQKTLQQATHTVNEEPSPEKQVFKNNLASQEAQLKNIHPGNGEAKKLINTAITQTEKAKGEVQSAETTSHGNQSSEHGNGNSHKNK